MLNHEQLWEELKDYVFEIMTDKEVEINSHKHGSYDYYENGHECGSFEAMTQIYEKIEELENK